MTLAGEGGSLSYCPPTAREDSLLILLDGQEKSRGNNQSLDSPTKTRERRRKEQERKEGEEKRNMNHRDLQRVKLYCKVFVEVEKSGTERCTAFQIGWCGTMKGRKN